MATGVTGRDAENLLGANRRIAPQILVVHPYHSVPGQHRANPLRDVHSPVARSPIGIHHLPARIAWITWPDSAAIAVELARIDRITLSESELPRLPLIGSGLNAQNFTRANRWVPSHVLVIHSHHAITG